MFARAARKTSRFGSVWHEIKSSQTFRSNSTSTGGSSSTSGAEGKRWARLASAVAGAAGAVGLGVLAASSSADHVHPPHHHWKFEGYFTSFDHAALRRGFEVYRQVCAACHSLDYIHYRELVGVTHTEEQAKNLAKTADVKDGPNDKGEYFERPGRLSDRMPRPYPNEEYARMINNGALPPDLSLIVKARHGGPDYLFALLTGYADPPAGVKLRDGLHYNPYFPGGAIGMAKALNAGAVEYEDGTPATEAQMARDVTEFLTWCSLPETETRKIWGWRTLTATVIVTGLAMYMKRFRWSVYKSRKITYKI